MTDLMRDDFKKLILDIEAFEKKDYKNVFNNIKSSHAGLLIQRGLPVWENGEKETKTKLVETIAKIKADDLYLLAFKRWLYQTYNPQNEQTNPHFAHVSANLTHRMYTELSAGSTLETGASTHHTYGMPMLAGSAIKGAVRTYAEHLFAERNDEGKIVFEQDPNDQNSRRIKIADKEKQKLLDVLFGKVAENDNDSDDAGYIIWHDAWWIPPVNSDGTLSTGNANKPFVSEIVTVHQQEYYNGNLKQALDMENPIPNQQIAIQGGFYFTVQGDDKWVNFAKELLVGTLQHQGMGAKGSSGYGYFECTEELEADIKKRFESMQITDSLDTDNIFAKAKQAIILADDKRLSELLSKDKKKLFDDNGLDRENTEHLQEIANFIYENKRDLVNSWENTDKKSNTKKAYKFIHNNLT